MRRLIYLSLAIVLSGLGGLSLTFAHAGATIGSDSAKWFAMLFLFLGVGYLLLAWITTLKVFNRPVPINEDKFLFSLTVAGFLASFPLATTFAFSDQTWLIAATSFSLALAPLVYYQWQKDSLKQTSSVN